MRSAAHLARRLLSLQPPHAREPAAAAAAAARSFAADAGGGGAEDAPPPKRRGRPPKAKPAEEPAAAEVAAAAPAAAEAAEAPKRAPRAPKAAAAPAAPASPRAPAAGRGRKPRPAEGLATFSARLAPRAELHSGLALTALGAPPPAALGAYFDLPAGLVPEADAAFYHDPALAGERGVRQADFGCKSAAAEFAATGRRALLLRPALVELIAAVEGGATPRLLLEGWTGAGKSAALLALVAWARASGWVALYIPSARLAVQGGRFVREDSEAEGGAPVWHTPEAARHLLRGVAAAHGEALKGLRDADGRPLADAAAAGLDPAAAPRDAVAAALALVDGLLAAPAGGPGPRTLVAIDDYNALYWRTGYHEPMHAHYRRPIAPCELPLAAGLRVLAAPPAPGAGGVAVAALSYSGGVSPALRLPRAPGSRTLRVPRYALSEVAAAAAALAAGGAVEGAPPPAALRRALALTNGNARELRQAAAGLLTPDSPLGLSLGYKAAAAARLAHALDVQVPA
jgi:small subunit ribosomal protein S29